MNSSFEDLAFLSWNRSQLITQVEGACERVLGMSSSQLLGQPLAHALGLSAANASRLHEKIETQPTVEFVQTLRHPTAWLRLRAHASDGTYHASVLNMTEILSHAPPLALEGWASQLSHEFRNPLSTIKLVLQTFEKSGSFREKDKLKLSLASREIRTLERMFSMLSELGRTQRPASNSMPLVDFLENVRRSVADELALRKVSVTVSEKNAAEGVLLDAPRLLPIFGQFLMNLASEARHPTRLDIETDVEEKCVVVKFFCHSTQLHSRGREKLLEPFGKKQCRNEGWSLSALAHAVHSHGGTVRVESLPESTVYVVTFPRLVDGHSASCG